MKHLVLVDGNSLLFRAYYATAFGDSSKIMRTKNGQATNAVYALSNIFMKLLTTTKPDYALVAFDTAAPTFRHQAYAEYKAGRRETPQDLIDQFAPSKELIQHLGFFCYELPGYEADDIIGTMARLGKEEGLQVSIFSGDRDLLQLIQEDVTVYLTKKGLSELQAMDRQALWEEYELTPNQIPDLKGLMGDKSDNIPGVSGVGEKTALKLLKEFHSVEAIVDATIPGKIGERIHSSRDIALASKKIATIDQYVPLPFSFEAIRYQGMALTNLRSFYQRLEMNSLLRRIPAQSESLEKEHLELPSKSIHVEDFSAIDTLSISSLADQTIFLHLEIQGDNYHTGEIQGLVIKGNSSMWYLTKEHLENNSIIHEILENPSIQKVAYDAKSLINGLHRYSYSVQGLIFDLQLAAYVLEPRLGQDPSEIFAYFDLQIPPRSAVYDKKSYNEERMKEYGSHFIAALSLAYLEATKRLQAQPSLHQLYTTIEFPLIFVLATMEQNGIRLDRNFLATKSNEIQNKILALEKAIYDDAGESFNINSPQQVARILFDVLQLPTSKKRSTAAGELDLLINLHPIVAKILDFRRYTKLQSVYLQGLPSYVHSDGKIHTIYNQALTQTGRLSSRDPNLQNITVRDPELKEVRKAFVASQPGWYLVSFDYSQIELRVLAHIANASEMIESYRDGIDIHTATAMKVFDVTQENVTSAMRREAKVVNFGIVYGMSDWGLSEELGINVKEAKAFIQRYFDGFPSVRKYMDDAIAKCEKLGYVSTEFGRIRPVPEIRDRNHNVREFGKRIAMNTPIQGTAADIMKLAMLKVDQALKASELHAKLLMQVHDELVLEAPLEELMRLIPLVQDAMEHAVSLRVPLKVEYHYGQNWHQ